ncbi:MAG: PAS domain S-box protein [Chloroflexota bacterium]
METDIKLSWLHPQSWSLPFRITIGILAIGIVLSVSSRVYTLWSIKNTVTHQIEQNFVLRASSMQDLIGTFLKGNINELYVLTMAPSIKDAIIQQNNTYPKNSSEVQEQLRIKAEQWRQAEDDTPFISGLMASKNHPSPPNNLLATFHKNLGEHSELFITDEHGAIVISTGRAISYLQSNEAWWQSVWQDEPNHIYIGDPIFDQGQEVIKLPVVLPILDTNEQKAIGVLCSMLSLAELLTLVEKQNFGQSGQAILLSADGVSLNKQSNVAQPDEVQAIAYSTTQAINTALGAEFTFNTNQENKALVVGQADFVSEDVGALDGFLREAQVNQAIHNLDWLTVIQQDVDEALQPIEQIANVLSLAVILTLTIATPIIFLIVKFIYRPLLSLTKAVEEVGRGNLDVTISPGKNNEIGRLANNLIEMISQLRHAFASLESRVDERTQELTIANERLQQEIEKQKLTQDALQNSEQRLRMTFENATDGFFFIDYESSRFISVNQQACLNLGYSRTELLALSVPEINAGPKAYGELYKDMEPGVPITTQRLHKRKDGSTFPVEIRAGVFDETDGKRYMVALARDITERKKHEEALEESNRVLQAIVEAIPSPVVISGFYSDQILFANDLTTPLLGYDKADMLGKQTLDFYPNLDDRKAVLNILKKKRSLHNWETKAQRRNGEEFDLMISIQPLTYGNESALLTIFTDITKRKQLEQTLAEARDQALETSRLKSELMAKVSHELRTPLGVILGFAELLGDHHYGELLDKQHDALNTIITSASDLSTLVDDLLDQAKLDAGSFTLKKCTFNPRDLLDPIESKMMVLAQTKGLRLYTDVSPNLPHQIFGDPLRLQQILLNLVSNAIKFTEQGTIKICIDCPNEHEWQLIVSDTGKGIPTQAQSTIFEPFGQVDSSLTRQQAGTGLGLSIVKQLTQLMAGEVLLESELHQGSIFTIKLPLTLPSE